jgi:hypothetical protein
VLRAVTCSAVLRFSILLGILPSVAFLYLTFLDMKDKQGGGKKGCEDMETATRLKAGCSCAMCKCYVHERLCYVKVQPE